MVDAPVSGGVPAAADATLTFIVGGDIEGMERARPLLMSMGSKAVHCGEAGNGCIAKVSWIVRYYCIVFCTRSNIALAPTGLSVVHLTCLLSMGRWSELQLYPTASYECGESKQNTSPNETTAVSRCCGRCGYSRR